MSRDYPPPPSWPDWPRHQHKWEFATKSATGEVLFTCQCAAIVWRPAAMETDTVYEFKEKR